MAGTYVQIAQATTNDAFKGRVQVACFTAAVQIINEAATTPNHELRRRLARQILTDPTTRIRQFVWICAANPTISDTVGAGGVVGATDADLQSVVNSNWDIVSGWSEF